MNTTINLIRVSGIQGLDGLYTFKAYSELRLQLSTGDFHVHKHEINTYERDTAEYWDLDENSEFYLVNEVTNVFIK